MGDTTRAARHFLLAALLLAPGCGGADDGSAAGSFSDVTSCSDIATRLAELVRDDGLDPARRIDADQRATELRCNEDLLDQAVRELSPTFDTASLEGRIRQDLEGRAEGIEIVSVQCPQTVNDATTFECTVHAADESVGVITATVDESGSVTWELTDVRAPGG